MALFNQPDSSVVKHMLSVREVRGSIPGPIKTQCRPRLATAVTFLAAQALSRGGGGRNSLQPSA